MARTTTNYGWNISEGSDIVNPLTDIFPNFESQDTDLKNVSDCSIGTATELKTGTVHALTRDDSDKDVFKFTATSNFTAGDTFTVDGDQVSALTTSGEQLQTGCYIIGSEVLVLKKGTLLTMYVSSDNAITLEGHSASYFAKASDLSDTNNDVSALSTKVGTATLTTTSPDLSGAVNELNSNLSDIYDTSLVSGTFNCTILFGSVISGLGAPSYSIPQFLKRKDVTITGLSGTNIMTYVSTINSEASQLPVRGDELMSIYSSGTGNAPIAVTFTYTVS